MTELDQTVDVDTTDVDIDTTNPEYSTLTEEQALGWKESLDKAISKYVKPWKATLEKFGVKTFAELEQKLSQEKENFITKESHELDKFLTKNEELSDKSEELLATAKALQSVPKYKDKSLQELLALSAKTLKVEEENQASQEKLKKSRVSDWDSFSELTVISKSEFEKIALQWWRRYAEISDKVNSGVITVKG